MNNNRLKRKSMDYNDSKPIKVLFLDFLYPKGHIRQNTIYINCISEFCKVYVLTTKGRYSDLTPEVEIIEEECFKIRDGKVFSRLSSLNIMFRSAIFARRIKPDYILISSYETIMFAVGRLFFQKKSKIFLLHHFNIDELNNNIKCYCFKSYMHKVNHIVFEDFIKDYIINIFELDESKIHILPHQLNKNIAKTNNKKYNCVGLSNSNDEKIISQIVNIEKQEQILKKSECKVILKSKVINYDNGFLKIINSYLDDNKYNEYINNSKSIYMPFSENFLYRMSGTLVDALSNNISVFGSNIILMNRYFEKYPQVCKVIDNADDFFKNVININESIESVEIKDFKQFKINHSKERIKQSLEKMFCEM